MHTIGFILKPIDQTHYYYIILCFTMSKKISKINKLNNQAKKNNKTFFLKKV